MRLILLYFTRNNDQPAIAAGESLGLVAPDLGSLIIELADRALELEQPDLAVQFMMELVRRRPTDPAVHLNFGLLLKSLGWEEEAERELLTAAGLARPEEAAYLASECHRRGQVSAAESLCRFFLARHPDSAAVLICLGHIQAGRGEGGPALRSYQRALAIRPDSAEAWYHLGCLYLQKLNQWIEAASCFQEAVRLRPDFIDAYLNLGCTRLRQGLLNEAFDAFDQARRVNPGRAEAWHNLGNLLLRRSANLAEAIACGQKALELNPDYTAACVALLEAKHKACDWDNLEELKERLTRLTEKDLARGLVTVEDPLLNLRWYDDPARNLAVAASISRNLALTVDRTGAAFNPPNPRSPGDKITIGYLSGHFNHHPITHLIAGLLRNHHRERFRILAYSQGRDDGTGQRAKISRAVDRFVDLSGLSDLQSAGMIHRDGVDILVDLTGHTQGGLLGVCAHKPAPVQVGYLGFLGTTGADFLDYFVTDRTVTPPDQAAWYTEKLIFLPHCYQVNDDALPVSTRTYRRQDFGLPEDALVFCCFNDAYKIEPMMFEVWMRILGRVNRGVLWLVQTNALASSNLRREAKARGVDPDRLIFSGRLPLEEHLARLKLADLGLDTRLYNGGATTSNLLWAGVPLVALEGRHFVSRMSASALRAAGLPELAAPGLEEYENLAVRLAGNPGGLAALRRKLARNITFEPLFDTARFTRNLEAAYEEIWRLFLSGQPPRSIEIKE
ncbi:MAG: tetratricopeptide repeat protein [Thermodesulfobacteriota bacterium]